MSGNSPFFLLRVHERQVKELRLRVQKECLDCVVRFELFVNPAELHRILESEVSIGIVPLQDTFYSRYLTYPVKALDFLSHGLPIVSSESPSLREVLHSAGCYCTSSSAREFARAVESLFENSRTYQAASLTVNESSKMLLWKLRAEKILQFCYSISWY